MSKLNLIATSSFGMESVAADELRELGYNDLKISNGRVDFTGDETDIAKCNIRLRCSERVLLKMAEFPAMDFEELFQGTLAVPWEKFIPLNGFMHVTGKSVKSQLFSVPDCQAIVKKAVVESMKRMHKINLFPEDGAHYKIEISMLNDMAVLSLDTSGNGLHKRGYRLAKGEAPLRETLAAGILRLSRWNPRRIFADPLCGSGTIAIEAAMLARNIAPGLLRAFAAEEWEFIPEKIWKTAREEASDLIKDSDCTIFASDIDAGVFDAARDNAVRAGVEKNIIFQRKPVEEFSSAKSGGCIVTNPPYGERLSDISHAAELYKVLGRIFNSLDEWSYFILSSHEEFAKNFGRKPDKNRKLYNGKIKTYLYSYYGNYTSKKGGKSS